jgi:hypothetical protein
MNSYLCSHNNTLEPGSYGTLRFEDLDDTRYTRTFGPAVVTAEDGVLTANGTEFYNKVNSFHDQAWRI